MRKFSTTLIPAIVAFAAALPVRADVLLMERVQQERGDLPTRGLSMAQVENRYGVPEAKLVPAGGDTPRHPVINRWEYPNFIVYFERDRVIDSVVKRADPTELGPKGVR